MEKSKVMRISSEPSAVQIMTDQKKQKNVKHFIYLCSMITNDARCTREIKSRIAMTKAAFNRINILLTRKLDLNFRKRLVKCHIWHTALYGAETWTFHKVDQKYLESFKMWCC